MSKRILLSPLDWGLGHSTRCVPLIRALLLRGNEVILGTTPLTEKIISPLFPQLERFEMPAVAMEYAKYLPVWAGIMLSYKRLKNIVAAEEKITAAAVKKFRPDVIISDNRYGFNHPSVKSVFISHQLNIQTPLFKKRANAIHLRYLHNFGEIWVPDFEKYSECLSGELSHPSPSNVKVKYIGPQSRLYCDPAAAEFDLLFLLSGPEPHRSRLEREVIDWCTANPNVRTALVRGTEDHGILPFPAALNVFHLPAEKELNHLINKSVVLVCRSGYSSVMDLYTVKKPAFLIPTPGQPEQEYLADFLNGKFAFRKLKRLKDLSPYDLKALAEYAAGPQQVFPSLAGSELPDF